MTREQKIKYLSLVASGEIIPAKPLPPGAYVPTNDAKPSFYGIWDVIICYWDKYVNNGVQVKGEDLFALPMSLKNTGYYCFIPADLLEQFQKFPDFKFDNFRFSALAFDNILIEDLTPEKIALHQLQDYEAKATENDVADFQVTQIYTKREFEKIIRPQLLEALEQRKVNSYFRYPGVTLNNLKISPRNSPRFS